MTVAVAVGGGTADAMGSHRIGRSKQSRTPQRLWMSRSRIEKVVGLSVFVRLDRLLPL